MQATLEYLLQRYADKTGTEQEREALMQLLRQDDSDEEAARLIGQMIAERTPRHEMPADAADAVLAAILQAGRAPVIPIGRRAGASRRLWVRRSVAAAVILLLASGAWMWLARNPRPATATGEGPEAMVADQRPGGSKARLTLDDGRTIVLDSLANGVVAKQAGATILKTGAGQLAYDPGDDGTGDVVYNTLSIPFGGQYQLVLPDGTKTWLNSGSSIRYPTAFRGAVRKIELTGEAYFEVVKNASKPFIVDVARKAEVEVLGTHFNINAYADEPAIATTLLEGSVRVTGSAARDSRRLEPGQQARIDLQGRLSVNRQADLNQVMAWKNGIFNFENADLPAVLRQLARWYDIEIVYEAGVPRREFGGKIQRDLNLSQILRILEKNNVHYRTEGRRLIIMK
ncbi:FecR family protein [Flaviaesturariibacter amylovorans]|uniref:DUF4974 domain-containing protein n=1 Tax=Flaviaesturariibacter amylovorans TaxID=1084520 RepID=A0ABP8GZU1_9BACT